jgi:hypothetical protein
MSSYNFRVFSIIYRLAIVLISSHIALCGVRYETTTDWGSGFNGKITILNDTGKDLNDWTLEFDFPVAIQHIWDARVTSRTNGHYVIGPAHWNRVLPAGGSLSFGFGASPGKITAGPQNFRLSGTPVVSPPPAPTTPPIQDPAPPPPVSPATPPAGISVNITPTGQWSGGFGANLVITNGGPSRIDGWSLRFRFNHPITSLWNGRMSVANGLYTVINESWNTGIPAGGSVSLGFNASGEASASRASDCALNGVSCTIRLDQAPSGSSLPPVPGEDAILIGSIDGTGEKLQVTVPQGSTTYSLRLRSQAPATFTVATNNPSVLSASITDSTLQLNANASGRGSVRIEDSRSGRVRYLGVRVRKHDGSLPGMPEYLAIGSVSEDTSDHMDFLTAFKAGSQTKRVDVRYIYLNGGPTYGWHTWSNSPGGRAVTYIRNSRKLGIIPFFVFYNIPDGGESYATDLAHVQDPSYMEAYFKNLKLALDIINAESPDDLVGMILEPDFLGYMAQNANQAPSAISAVTRAVYDSGVLSRAADPSFPDTVAGLVQAINYTISKYAPQIYFGWQVNLWASPPLGWTTRIPGNGIIRKTDAVGVAQGRPLIYGEAAAITKYYLAAGVATYGARFLSIDKYGLDAAAVEASAAMNPAGSIWFWNNDHWQNYLTFVRAMRDTSGLPVILWQLPVGHINSSQRISPYTNSKFMDLPNANRSYEDSTSTFFFGDSFVVSGPRLSYFSANAGGDASLSVSGNTVRWGSHLSDAASAGVIAALFGAGVGTSTTNIGVLPTDNFWWISAVQSYYQQPVPLR